MPKWPAKHRIRRRCVVCERPFSLWLSQLHERRQGMFCTQNCHHIARLLFRRMLMEGRLAPLLKEELMELQKEEASKSGRVSQGRQSELMRLGSGG
jgi:ferredoxin